MTDQKHKIRMLVPIRYPVGGIRTYLKYTYGKLDKNKYAFDFVAPSNKWLDRIHLDLDKFEIVTYHTSNENSNLALLNTIFSLAKTKNYHIIHSQGYTAGILSNLANIFVGLPHIITLHHIFGHGQFSDSFWKHLKKLKRITIEYILTRTTVIQAVSNDATQNLFEYFPGLTKDPNKVVTIVNGINVDNFAGDYISLEPPFKKAEGLFYVGFIGRYMPEKGFNYLIKVMDFLVNLRNIHNIRVVSAGGFGGFIREYKKEIEKLNLNNYFIFLDFLADVRPLLKTIDILVIPSLGEACGLAAMEGLVCGVPVIAFNCIGLREVLSNTPAKLVQVGNVDDLSNCIVNATSNYQNFKNMAVDFIQEAKERFDSKKTAFQLDQLINTLTK